MLYIFLLAHDRITISAVKVLTIIYVDVYTWRERWKLGRPADDKNASGLAINSKRYFQVDSCVHVSGVYYAAFLDMGRCEVL